MGSCAMWLWRSSVLLGLVGSKGVVRGMCAQVGDWQAAKSIYEFSAKDIDGNEVSLDKYKGFVCIITNVASK